MDWIGTHLALSGRRRIETVPCKSLHPLDDSPNPRIVTPPNSIRCVELFEDEEVFLELVVLCGPLQLLLGLRFCLPRSNIEKGST
jgi:hypothetical protein